MKTSLQKILTIGAIAALALTGCSDDNDSANNGNGSSDSGNTVNTAPIRMAIVHGWDEGIAATFLWKAVLEEKGYNVEVIELTDAGPTFATLAEGDLDIYTDTWLPYTNAAQVEEFGENLIDLGSWNDDAKLTFAVNADAPITSLEELAEHAEAFDNKIFSIEPGSGTAGVAENTVMPAYGLEGMELVTSSTAGMLAELNAALTRGDNIVVTLWQPHWAYDAFDVRNLEDPQIALGDSEGIHAFARAGFDEDYPEVAAWLQNFYLDTETLHSLENVMFGENENESDFEPIVADWISQNQDYVDSLTQ